ncbi:hypothetical protein QOZ80_5BG0428230 [Eleusine coracana subsp. coracana]|nr:hypothetical protein QOZ80_5BG0428230 [Eleusine coracana subsp. coracana]
MSKEEILKVQTSVLKVNIHCDGCEKKIKKILRKIEGVYQSSIDAKEGKVTVSGLVDAETIVKKLNKAGKPAAIWGAKPGVVSQSQKPQLGEGDGATNGGAGEAEGSSSAVRDVKMVMPQPTPQQLEQLQQLQLKGTMPPFPAAAAAAAAPAAATAKDPKSVRFNLTEEELGDNGNEIGEEFDESDDGEFEDVDLNDNNSKMMLMKPTAMPPNMMGGGAAAGGSGNGGKKGNEIPMLMKGVANNGGGGKQNAGGGQGNSTGANNNGGGGAAKSQNGNGGGAGAGAAPGGGMMMGSRVVGGPMGGMPPQAAGMMRPPNMMGRASFPGVGQMGGGGPMSMPPVAAYHPHMSGKQPPAGVPLNGMPPNGMAGGPGFYQGGGSGMQSAVTPEMMQGAAGNHTMAQQQQQHMAMMQQQQQQQQMMMNGGHHGGNAGYPPMGYGGYGHGHGRPPMQYPMQYPAPPPNHAEPYNIFSDENLNSSCSVM